MVQALESQVIKRYGKNRTRITIELYYKVQNSILLLLFIFLPKEIQNMQMIANEQTFLDKMPDCSLKGLAIWPKTIKDTTFSLHDKYSGNVIKLYYHVFFDDYKNAFYFKCIKREQTQQHRKSLGSFVKNKYFASKGFLCFLNMNVVFRAIY